ncbi:hypothetical protein [Devosia naphthalenivorans]|uniref:hypothetical protein n=1 Tax=Devosia naphthalenivorans TaxID=2082392 RepID=UPI000D393F77|nr:hypothetical protein [Devosia naphthalenivorans]
MTNRAIDPTETENPEIEYSVHSGPHSHNGVEVEVSIFRLAGTNDEWTLEVENRLGGSTIWEDTFPSDGAAYSEFIATLAKDGIEQFEFDDPIVH